MAGFRSGFERTLSAQLKAAKARFKYEPRKLAYVIEHNYIPDFELANGIIIEAKGKLTPSDRAKMIAVKRAHPHLDIRFVFMRGANKLTSRSKTTYMDWAARNGFPCADGRIPTEWINE